MQKTLNIKRIKGDKKLSIREFNYKLTELLNTCGLPIDVIELALEKFLAEVRLAVDRAIAQESKKQEESEQNDVQEEQKQEVSVENN